MIKSQKNADNSAIFMQELQNHVDQYLVIIVKKHQYLPSIQHPQLIIILYEEPINDDLQGQFSHHPVFFQDHFSKQKHPSPRNGRRWLYRIVS